MSGVFDFLAILALLGIFHLLADGPFQPAAMSQAKRRGGDPAWHWDEALAAHVSVHGMGVVVVLVLTGHAALAGVLGLAEACAHAAIDFAKCRRWLGTAADQALHVCCKGLWAAIAVWGGAA